MKTEFAKALAKGENVIGKEVVLLDQGKYYIIKQGDSYTITDATWVPSQRVVRSFKVGGVALDAAFSGNDFEFKHVLDEQKEDEAVTSVTNYYITLLAQADDKIKYLKEQLDGALEINKQYEQQLFDLRMENARLELAAQRWEMFDSPVNREIADKLLKKLADEQGE